MKIKDFWSNIVNFFNDNIWNIILFFAVLLIGVILIKITLRLVRRFMNRAKVERMAQKFLITIIKYLLYLVLVLALLSLLGVQISGVLTALSALLLAVGMALQSNISNLANGIIIVSTRMFKRGDYINVDGIEGSIEEINFLFTTLLTPDNKKIFLPNSTIVNNCVVNSTANQKRRIDFNFKLSLENNVELVKKIVLDVMKSDGRVYLSPEPFCRLNSLDANKLEFFANCWVDDEDYWDVYFNITETVFNEFKKYKVLVCYNQLQVTTRNCLPNLPYNVSPLPQRVAKKRLRKQTSTHEHLQVKLFKKCLNKDIETNDDNESS